MKKLLGLAALAVVVSSPTFAASQKETDCFYQASVVAAVQNARLKRVSEGEVAGTVMATADWPERYSDAIPLITPWVYEMKMGDLRKENLAAAWQQMCMAQ